MEERILGLDNVEQRFRRQEAEIEELRINTVKGEAQRRAMHNELCELKGNIRVFCRVRPTLAHDEAARRPLRL